MMEHRVTSSPPHSRRHDYHARTWEIWLEILASYLSHTSTFRPSSLLPIPSDKPFLIHLFSLILINHTAMEELRQALKKAGIWPNTVAFTVLGREYSVLATIRLVVCICGYLVIRRAVLMYVRRVHMQRLEEGEEGKADESGAPVEEVTVDKDKPKGDEWGSKARRRQREARKRAEAEAERRNLEEESGGIDKYLD